MSQIIETHANERSTFAVDLRFYDESGLAVVPNTLNWSLTDAVGNIVNGHDNDIVAVPSLSNQLLFSGDDLAFQKGESKLVKRIITVEMTYDSALGTDLPLNDEIIFFIDDLMLIPRP